MWLWSWDTARRGYGFTVLDCPNRLDQLLVRIDMSPSIAEATRLIKQGSVRIRPHPDIGIQIWTGRREAACSDWREVKEPRFLLPEGKVIQVRVGRSPGVRLITREGRDGWDSFKTFNEIMFPAPGQGIRSWTALMCGDGAHIPWLAYWTDWLEHRYAEFKTWYQSLVVGRA